MDRVAALELLPTQSTLGSISPLTRPPAVGVELMPARHLGGRTKVAPGVQYSESTMDGHGTAPILKGVRVLGTSESLSSDGAHWGSCAPSSKRRPGRASGDERLGRRVLAEHLSQDR